MQTKLGAAACGMRHAAACGMLHPQGVAKQLLPLPRPLPVAWCYQFKVKWGDNKTNRRCIYNEPETSPGYDRPQPSWPSWASFCAALVRLVVAPLQSVLSCCCCCCCCLHDARLGTPTQSTHTHMHTQRQSHTRNTLCVAPRKSLFQLQPQLPHCSRIISVQSQCSRVAFCLLLRLLLLLLLLLRFSSLRTFFFCSS